MCERLDDLGAIVYAISRSPQHLTTLKQARPNIKTLALDLSDWTNTKTELTTFLATVQIDGLVNNAGLGSGKSVYELTEQDFDEYVFGKRPIEPIQIENFLVHL